MIAQKVATQAEIDTALQDNFGITPTGKFTSDKSQQLYVNKEGKGFIPNCECSCEW